jgi:hypothetical protein
MSLIKESLHQSIDQMSEEQAEAMLMLIRAFHQKHPGVDLTLFVAPSTMGQGSSAEAKAFKSVHPVSGKGTPASRLLIAERR